MARERPVTRKHPLGSGVLGNGHDVSRLASDIRMLVQRVGDHGLVATPDMSIRDMVGAVAGTRGRGGLIWLSEGTWDFRAAGVTIARTGIAFVALYPGRTVFRRSATATGPLLTLSGGEVVLDGIRFDDAAGSQPCVKVTGDRNTVRNCWFEDCYQAIECNTANWVRVTGNHVQANRYAGYAIRLSGTASGGLVAHNFVEPVLTTQIVAGSAISRTSFVGNVTPAAGGLEYYGALGNEAAGNVAVVTVR